MMPGLLQNEWTFLLVVMGASVFTVLATVLIHYEALTLVSRFLHPRFKKPRQQMIVVVLGIFSAHTVEVWLYALVYYLLDQLTPMADILDVADNLSGNFLDYLYFSTVSYTSLGLGDLYPVGPLRLLTGVESLVCLIHLPGDGKTLAPVTGVVSPAPGSRLSDARSYLPRR